ncbi:MAG: hypothetical protein A2039_09115 [Candidatus Melainabacteria bacterium GWA2_34_9]|nr:MAG: hypothetical protein A2039_09115 [Candidatus Melainabacteria bacterium GWA2_34_9]
MEIIIIPITILSIGYIIFMFLDEGGDSNVQRRLTEYSSGYDKRGNDDTEEQDSKDFLANSMSNIAKNIAEKSKNLVMQKQLLAEAGLASDDDAVLKHIQKKVTFTVGMTLMALIMFFGGSGPPIIKMMILLMGPLFGFKLPDIMLKSKSKNRADEVTYSLPDALDLLTVCVEAGLGLDSAISRVAQEQKNSAPILAYEFQRVSKDILAGIPRSDAFRNLLKRNASQELRSFVGLLIQSDKLGTSISQSLRVYSDALRIKRRQKAEELASKAGVKMSLPLVLFILPATFVVILAPAGISMYTLFTSSGAP